LIKVGDEFVDAAALEFTYDVDPDGTGPDGETHYHGEPGFVCFRGGRGLVIVNSRHVVRLRAEDGEDNATEVETARGERLTVVGKPDHLAALLNKARLRVG
jgi:hypothetical protein